MPSSARPRTAPDTRPTPRSDEGGDRVQHDLGRKRGVLWIRRLRWMVADAVLARDEDHGARHARRHAHRVVGGAGDHGRVRRSARGRSVGESADDPRVHRGRRQRLALVELRAHSPGGRRPLGERPDVAGDAVEGVLVGPPHVEREANALRDRVDQPRDGPRSRRRCRPWRSRRSGRGVRAREPTRRARVVGSSRKSIGVAPAWSPRPCTTTSAWT